MNNDIFPILTLHSYIYLEADIFIITDFTVEIFHFRLICCLLTSHVNRAVVTVVVF